MFLDIEMPLLKGNDFLKKLKNPPKVIFTTAYREYALEGYELNVIDYLLKPITFDRFFVSIEKFKQLQIPKTPEKATTRRSHFCIFRKQKHQNCFRLNFIHRKSQRLHYHSSRKRKITPS